MLPRIDRREDPDVIAAGTLILSASGSLNARLGEMTAFAVTLVTGVAVLFLGSALCLLGYRITRRSHVDMVRGLEAAVQPAART